MTEADYIWNRAALDEGSSLPCVGDRALSLLLKAHGLVMNGGIFHAVELLSAQKFAGAKDGYRFFGFPQVADLLDRALRIFNEGRDLESYESVLGREYELNIPNDSALVARFESQFHSHPEDFAPL